MQIETLIGNVRELRDQATVVTTSGARVWNREAREQAVALLRDLMESYSARGLPLTPTEALTLQSLWLECSGDGSEEAPRADALQKLFMQLAYL